MSNRNNILDSLVSCLQNITVNNGFNNDVYKVERKFLYYDNVFNFPYLLVLGGAETLDDELDSRTVSTMTVRIIGYHKDLENPEVASCNLLEDVLKCLDNDTYNTVKSKMRPIDVETDEGVFHELGAGLSMFVLSLEIIYRFERSNP